MTLVILRAGGPEDALEPGYFGPREVRILEVQQFEDFFQEICSTTIRFLAGSS